EHHPGSVVLVKSLFDSVNDLERLLDRVSQLIKAIANPVSKKPVAMEEVVWAVLQRLERQILRMGAAAGNGVVESSDQCASTWQRRRSHRTGLERKGTGISLLGLRQWRWSS